MGRVINGTDIPAGVYVRLGDELAAQLYRFCAIDGRDRKVIVEAAVREFLNKRGFTS